MPFCNPQRNLKKSRQHVHVFVPVEVRWHNARIANFLNLRVPLILHFRQREPAPRAAQKLAAATPDLMPLTGDSRQGPAV